MTLPRKAGDGVVAEATASFTPTGSTDLAVTVTVPDLEHIEYLMDIRSDDAGGVGDDPGNPESIDISGNIVGATLYNIAAGGTVDVTVTVVGS